MQLTAQSGFHYEQEKTSTIHQYPFGRLLWILIKSMVKVLLQQDNLNSATARNMKPSSLEVLINLYWCKSHSLGQRLHERRNMWPGSQRPNYQITTVTFLLPGIVLLCVARGNLGGWEHYCVLGRAVGVYFYDCIMPETIMSHCT